MQLLYFNQIIKSYNPNMGSVLKPMNINTKGKDILNILKTY
jgi:hypothetical protein